MTATLGDALGAAGHFVATSCKTSYHQVCLGHYGGRSCECPCHVPAPRFEDDPEERQERVKQDAYEHGFDRETE